MYRSPRIESKHRLNGIQERAAQGRGERLTNLGENSGSVLLFFSNFSHSVYCVPPSARDNHANSVVVVVAVEQAGTDNPMAGPSRAARPENGLDLMSNFGMRRSLAPGTTRVTPCGIAWPHPVALTRLTAVLIGPRFAKVINRGHQHHHHHPLPAGPAGRWNVL